MLKREYERREGGEPLFMKKKKESTRLQRKVVLVY